MTAADADGDDEEPSGLMFEIDRTGADTTGTDLALATKNNKGKPRNVSKEQTDNNDSDEESGSDDNEDEIDGDEEEDDISAGPAWVDEDDDDLEVDLLGTNRLRKLRKNRDESQPLRGDDLQKRLRARYKSTMQATAQTQWARLDDENDEEEDDKQKDDDDEEDNIQLSSQPLLLQGKGSAVSGSTARLPPNILNVMRCPDANQADYNKAVVQAVHFHPGSDPDQPLMLTAGLDKTLRFFSVGTEKSEKLHGIHCKYSICCCATWSLDLSDTLMPQNNCLFSHVASITTGYFSSKASHLQCLVLG
jgi:U3 small nucleolar RNA-associated protein 18